jgi:hypothetical protein
MFFIPSSLFDDANELIDNVSWMASSGAVLNKPPQSMPGGIFGPSE